MKDCVFCKIVRNELDSAKIWENDEFVAILGNHPTTKGMTVLISKKHYNSYIINSMPDNAYSRFLLAVKKVSNVLEKGLKVKKVAMVMEGMNINHAHIKLYPLHGVKCKVNDLNVEKDLFFDKYPGYITTLEGNYVELSKLKNISEKIKKNAEI
jgi:histidine triad (HIT) family protein